MIEYQITDEKDLEKIRLLWEQLNEHHHAKARHFQRHYETWNFDDRKAYFEKCAGEGTLRIDLAFDNDKERYVGYCASSISKERHGEIESIFIEEVYRSQGLGTELLSRVISWMDAKGVVRKRVAVADGNEDAWGFYQRFGFYPRMMMLEQKNKQNGD
jgi:GNAT superfamily N-acetyltransferase